MIDDVITIDFGVGATPRPLRWFFMVVPLDALRRHLWMTKQYAVGSHEEAVRAWIADEPVWEFMRPFLARRGTAIGGYYVARWSEECLNTPAIGWEMRRMHDEAKWVEPRWFDKDGNAVEEPKE